MNLTGLSEDFDPRIAAWLQAGPDRAPADLPEGVLSSFASIHQRHGSMAPPWTAPRWRAGLGAFAILTVVAITAVALSITGPWASSVGGTGGPVVAPAVTQVRLEWLTDDGIAVTITRDPSDRADHYWRAMTYDVIGTNGWSVGPSTTTSEAADANLADSIADDVDVAGLSETTTSVEPGTFTSSIVLSPGVPMRVDQPVTLTTTGPGGYLSRIDRQGPSSYDVTALVGGEGSASWSVGALRAAGTDYPADIANRYLGVATGTIGPNARALEQRIVASSGSRDPVDLVEAAMSVFRSNQFTYSTDLRGLHCESLSTVECFATYKQGFCQYYAATMAVLLRDLGIPTRIVEGFLPGMRSGDMEVIRNAEAHAWVEVYFPGRGWIPFDPTGANAPAQLPATLPS
jgi:transglutaminase superfamily protein